MDSTISLADLEDQKIVLQTVHALGEFGSEESLDDDAKVWITKREACLLHSFIYGLLYRLFGHDGNVQEEQ